VNRVTLDSNIYVSALQFGGKPKAVLEMGLEGEIDVAVSQPIIDETIRVLREKFGWSDAELRTAEIAISTSTQRVSPTEILDVVKADPTDDRILECAVAAGSQVIVTGDKHLLAVGNFRGIEVMTVSDFLQRDRSR
jgi:uncharacterized protein